MAAAEAEAFHTACADEFHLLEDEDEDEDDEEEDEEDYEYDDGLDEGVVVDDDDGGGGGDDDDDDDGIANVSLARLSIQLVRVWLDPGAIGAVTIRIVPTCARSSCSAACNQACATSGGTFTSQTGRPRWSVPSGWPSWL